MRIRKTLGIALCLSALFVTPCFAKEYVNTANGFSVNFPAYDVKISGQDFIVGVDFKTNLAYFAGNLNGVATNMSKTKVNVTNTDFLNAYKNIGHFEEKNNGRPLVLKGSELNQFLGLTMPNIPDPSGNYKMEDLSFTCSATHLNEMPAIKMLAQKSGKNKVTSSLDLYVLMHNNNAYVLGTAQQGAVVKKKNEGFMKSLKLFKPSAKGVNNSFEDFVSNYTFKLPNDWVYAQMNYDKKNTTIATIALPYSALSNLKELLNKAPNFFALEMKQLNSVNTDKTAAAKEYLKQKENEDIQKHFAVLLDTVGEWAITVSNKDEYVKKDSMYKSLYELGLNQKAAANLFIPGMVNKFQPELQKEGIKLELKDFSVNSDEKKNVYYNATGRISYKDVLGLKLDTKVIFNKKALGFVGYFKADNKNQAVINPEMQKTIHNLKLEK